LDLITWTYDPLEATNAHLNIAKLGAITRTYLRNIYGASPSHLHTGLETDRFLAEWWIRCPRVEQRLRERPTVSLPMGTVQVIRTAWEGGFARVIGVDSAASAPSIAVEIPADIQALKAVDLDAARAWRAATRTALEAYLARGYVVAEVVREREADGRQRVWYLLTREVEGWTDAD
jgi:predicted GNAT superfamily acetyltransferase